MTPGILYISYDGMLEPLGQSQVFAYLERLAPERRIHLISFEKSTDWRNEPKRALLEQRIAAAGIHWHPLTYHKRPTAPATAFDIAHGTGVALSLAVRHRLSIVHARSYVPALIALAVKRATGARFLFDMRGLWADERVDGGLWPKEGRLYRTTKKIERQLLLAADQVVTLTRASVPELRRIVGDSNCEKPIAIIPTCADLDRFRPCKTGERPFTLGFVGSASLWSLFDEVLAIFTEVRLRRPDARLLVVNRGEHDFIRARAVAHGVAEQSVEVLSADHRDVPALVNRMDVGAAVRRASYSQISCAPTKLAEYLGCGIPVIVNARIGDAADIVERKKVGVVLPDFGPASIRAGVERLFATLDDPSLAARCRNTATDLFSLDQGVAAYDVIYHDLATRTGAPAANSNLSQPSRVTTGKNS